MTKDKQSTSPGGTYEVRCSIWEPRNSLWVYPPEIVESSTGRVIFNFKDPHWSSDYSEWQSPTKLRLGLRKYPGDKLPRGLVIEIDLTTNIAVLESEEIPLTDLEGVLTRHFENT